MYFTRLTVLAALLAVQMTPFILRAEVRYNVVELPTFGGTAGDGNGLNDLGHVAGQSPTTNGVQHAYLYDGSSLIDLVAAAGKFEGTALGINNLSQVVGYERDSELSAPNHAFVYENGVTTDLGTLGGFASRAYGIDNGGRVVGQADTPSSIHAFIWSSATGMADLGALGGFSGAYAINDAGQVTGYTGIPAGANRAFVWTPSTGMVALGTLGGRNSEGRGINNVGQICGISYTAFADGNSQEHAFLYDPQGGMRDLGTLGASSADLNSEGYGINDEGWVVGTSTISENPEVIPHAFVYDGTSMRDLNDLIDPSLGWTMFYANDINNAGQIIVDAVDLNHRYRALLLTPVPEPGVAGVATVAALSLRRRSSRSR